MKQGIIQSYHLGQLFYFMVVFTLFIFSWFFSSPWGYGSLTTPFGAIDLAKIWHLIPLALALIPIAYEGIELLLQGKISTEFFLIIASIIAIAGNEIHAITIVLLIMLIAHYIEDLIKERTEEALGGLVKLIPSDVLIVSDGIEHVVPIESVTPGMLVVIKTGGRVPVDGIIKTGEASVQEAFLTGESVSQHKGPGELVYAGTYLEAGSITIEAQKVGENTFFSKISSLLEEAGRSKAHVVQLTDRITAIFTPAFLIFISIVWLITGDISIIITLLVFGSPLELSLVTPLTLLAAIVAAFRRGILIKSGASLEYLASTTVMLFDKTGTLTMGTPEVISIASLDPAYNEKAILRLAAIAEKKSGHVLARAILERAAAARLVIPDPDTYVSVTGHGIAITFEGEKYMLGNRHFIEAVEHGNIPLPVGCAVRESLTTFYIATEHKVIGEICLADRIKEEARQMVSELKKRGLSHLELLSGDKQTVAEHVAQELGIPVAHGAVMPDEKLALLRKMQQEGSIVTMVGDGINDAPALKQAHVGIALGGMGMEPAIAAADIVLMSGNLDQIVFLYDLSRAAMRTIKQNLIIGFALTHTCGIILALFSLLTPVQAALFHAIPDFLILLNAARLINFGSESRRDL